MKELNINSKYIFLYSKKVLKIMFKSIPSSTMSQIPWHMENLNLVVLTIATSVLSLNMVNQGLFKHLLSVTLCPKSLQNCMPMLNVVPT